MLSVGLGKLGKGAKKLVTNPVKWAENAGRSVGKVASDGAPLAGLIPGVGTLYGGSIGLLGSVAAGNDMKTSLNKAVQGGLSGFANTQFLGGQGFKGIPAALHMGGSPLAEAQSALNPAGPSVGITGGNGVAGTVAHAGDMGADLASPASSGLLSKFGKVADFAEAHPNATAGALEGISNIAGGNSEGRLRDAQARNLERQADETEYDFAQRKRREELMKPLWSALGTGFVNTGSDVAPNPYGG